MLLRSTRVARAWLRVLLCVGAWGGYWLWSPLAAAQLAVPSVSLPLKAVAEEATDAEPNPGSPRAALQKYLELTSKGHYADAGAFLDVPKDQEGRRPELAKRLRAVLDRYVRLDLDKVSELDDGSLSDGLPARFEQIGVIPAVAGVSEPVRLARHAGAKSWTFSFSTVEKVDDWYEALPDRWLREHLPAPLLRAGPRDLLWWQWGGIGLIAFGGAAFGILVGALFRNLLTRAAKHTAATWDNRVLARSRGPVALAFAVGFLRAMLPFLLLYEPAETFIHQALRGLFLANVLWAVWRTVDVIAELSLDSPRSLEHAASRALIPLARRTGKALVAIAATLLFLSALGYPVTSLIAGLGIGGLALALASQKTVENLFGAFSLGIDQPFREGDFVRIENLTGTVESLGLRSTRIRTLDRTVVSIPNGKLAEMRLETFAARDRLRLACVIGLVYGSSAEQVRSVLSGIEAKLLEHPKIWRDGVSVRFIELAASAMNIEVACWFDTRNFDEFTLIRQDLLLAFLEVVEQAGTSLAFPTQTVHLASEPSRGSAASPK
jgi:MscS family membrane protein